MDLREQFASVIKRGRNLPTDIVVEMLFGVLRDLEPVATYIGNSAVLDHMFRVEDETLPRMSPLFAAPVPPAESVLDEIGAMLGIGEQARTLSVIKTNIENMQRRAACLSAIEREFFTVTNTYDEGDCEPGDEGATYDECLLNWGADPAEYLEQFRASFAGGARVPPAESAVPDGWRLVPVEPVTGAEYEVGNWSRRNWEAALRDQLAAAPKPECHHQHAILQQTGDGTPVEFCPDCGRNEIVGSAPESESQ